MSAPIPSAKNVLTLADDLVELVEIVNAGVGLAESVLNCVRIYERDRGAEGLFGPSEGLSWIMSTLDNKAREVRDRALREQEESK